MSRALITATKRGNESEAATRAGGELGLRAGGEWGAAGPVWGSLRGLWDNLRIPVGISRFSEGFGILGTFWGGAGEVGLLRDPILREQRWGYPHNIATNFSHSFPSLQDILGFGVSLKFSPGDFSSWE